MLFVGAGASKPFGAPILSDLTTDVMHIVESYGYGDLWSYVYNSLRVKKKGGDGYFASNDEIDMEVVLSVIDLIMNPIKKAQELGPILHYLSKNTSKGYKGKKPSPKEYLKIRKKIENKIVALCNNLNFGLAINYYRKLFELEKNVHIQYLNARGEQPRTLPFEHTVTTNYDLVLERYSFACDLDDSLPTKHFFRRGFKRDYNEAELGLQLGYQMEDKLRYLKLHGSIDWWVRKRDGAIISRDSYVSLYGETYPYRTMIYPAYDKKVSIEPFASLHNHFRKFLQSDDVYVVIGYSFRDSSINDIILDALRDERKRMVIVNRTIDKIRPKLRDFPHERIDVVLCPFGRTELFAELEATLTRMPQGFE